MELREFFSEEAVQLELQGTSKDEVLKELIGLLKLDDKSEGMLFKMLKRRENLGSTGIGRGIAIPHCRSLVVNRLRVAFGRKKTGVEARIDAGHERIRIGDAVGNGGKQRVTMRNGFISGHTQSAGDGKRGGDGNAVGHSHNVQL